MKLSVDIHKKAHVEFYRAHVEKEKGYSDTYFWSEETKINVFEIDGFKSIFAKVRSKKKNVCYLQ